MKDNFSEYMNKQREALDADLPNEGMIWDGIESDMLVHRYQKRMRLWQAAAIVALLISASYIGWDWNKDAQLAKQSTPASSEIAQGPIATVESSYQAQLATLQEELEARQADPVQLASYYEELKTIEETAQDFSKDLPITSNKQQLAMILVDTYEKKIRLLEKMLLEIDREERRRGQESRRTNDRTTTL